MTETENVIHKNGIYDFNVTTEEDKPLQKSVFYTQDSGGTARLIFNIDKDNQDLVLSSAAELELAMILAVGKESESKYLVKPTVVDGVRGIAEYTLTDSQIAHDGNAIAELYIKYKNSQAMRVYKFSFEIKKALIDSDFFPVKEYYVERWDDYEKIFDESFERLNNKLDDVDKKADDLKTQFDAMQPSQFAQKTVLDEHVNDADIHVTATDKTNWNAKETVEGAQAKADKALADAKAFFELSSSVQSVTLTPKNGFVAIQTLVARYVKFGNRFLVLVGGIVGKGTGTGTGVCATTPTFLAPDTGWNKLYSAAQQSTAASNQANIYLSSGGDINIIGVGATDVNTGLDGIIYLTKEVTT
ncbi:BppU family phage baseplate upper protein [Listeria monocytogenes]|nr:BppU family phage baseplate upper protein [Listeria monocytogenes]EIZ2531135.1 BppU family phage baseplate upper protein [Listeria monocytogenes]EIZ2584615.1 BppU family phage baseplate upper protein [Listeria monocytogenes]EIZ2674781.1 BppU family phage baseplate upper protein [Listeria monocytogenes]EIZ2697959.1 BppU family phage baseplate upper protein [Listeria monocytogenes]